jgi:hypothetical protein
MAKRFPLHPAHPERTCWGCDRYCPAHAMACGNGSDRTQHPEELFGPDWAEWVPPPKASGARTRRRGAPPGPTLTCLRYPLYTVNQSDLMLAEAQARALWGWSAV